MKKCLPIKFAVIAHLPLLHLHTGYDRVYVTHGLFEASIDISKWQHEYKMSQVFKFSSAIFQ